MFTPITRRRFVTASAQAGALAALGNFSFLDGLPRLSAAAAPGSPGAGRRLVPLEPDVEPLVKLIEDTPRKVLLDKVADAVRKGTSYQELLSAVFLAGVRGIQPRPVGFKFHAVLVINSAHLAAQASSDNDRWLPLFWALDNFKASQARNAAEGDWRMAPAAEAKLPSAAQARQRFIEAMDNWDEEATDRAITALARCAGAAEVYELFWRYGARDFRDIGHKIIYAANSWRTLQAIGWRHAEPVVRSLAYAMLMHRGPNPAKGDDEADRPGRANLKLARELKALGRGGKRSPEAAQDLLAALRTASPAEGSGKVVELLKKGVHLDSIWEGVFLAAGELLMRKPGIGSLHSVTTANALYFAHQTTGSDETRRFLALQAGAFLPMFRQFVIGRDGRLPAERLDRLEKAEVKAAPAEAIADIFADVSRNRMRAAQKVLGLLEKDPAKLQPLMAAARRLIFSKGRDSHDYKFSSAALEDYYHLSPAWRARFAAASVFWLKGSGERDNDLIRRTRAALATT
jgi:hypothetical protein